MATKHFELQMYDNGWKVSEIKERKNEINAAFEDAIEEWPTLDWRVIKVTEHQVPGQYHKGTSKNV